MVRKKFIIGLETHIQLNTLSTKLFCNCSLDKKTINTSVCHICLGHPGSMVFFKEKTLEKYIQVCKALNFNIAREILFDRKHYVYRDIPKNYQVTQYRRPIGLSGVLEYFSFINNVEKIIPLQKLIIEEDPGKTIIGNSVDFNRSGTPLMEIVTNPIFSTYKECVEYLKALKKVIESLQITDFKKDGSFRTDLNISFIGSEKVEIKNIGSLEGLKIAILFEKKRQNEEGIQKCHTRSYDEFEKITFFSRIKESEKEYLYTPEYDIPAINCENLVKNVEKPLTVYDKYKTLKSFDISSKLKWSFSLNDICYHFIIKYGLKLKDPKPFGFFLSLIYRELLNKDYVKEPNYINLYNIYISSMKNKISQNLLKRKIRDYFRSGIVNIENIKTNSLKDIFYSSVKDPIFKSCFDKYIYDEKTKTLNYIIGILINKTKGTYNYLEIINFLKDEKKNKNNSG